MRQLAQAEVLKSAITAAAISSILCLPRVWLWPTRKYPVWYLEALLFLGGTVLWAFVFAWHTKYTSRPVFRVRIEPALLAGATTVGVSVAVVLMLALDPALRAAAPEDYPKSFSEWLAKTLFSLAFTQMFLVFAPSAWLMRLSGTPWIAIPLTVMFGVCVAVLRNHSSLSPMGGELMTKLMLLRAVGSLLCLYFYWRGGALLAWWVSLLILSRHLAHLLGDG
jgi:hypothetical protein